ncbi:MAG TPA: copper-binding protein [Burkholderiales bacterium]|nr:copper-binding protein [Burkholderiales bacterium]
MKRLAFLALAALAAPALAQSDMKGMDMKTQAAATAHKASGVITRVDPAKSKVTIKHGPVHTLNWPPMTMAFTVKDKGLLDKLKKDQKVDFEFVQQGKDYVVTSVK